MQVDIDVSMVDKFCEKHSLRWRISDEGEPTILADAGFIYCYDEDRELMGVSFYPDELPGVDSWNETCQACLRVGMAIIADRIYQSYLSFSPTDATQCALAVTICGARRSRMTEAEREHLKVAVGRMRKRKAAKELAAQKAEALWRWKMLTDSFEL